MIKGLRQVMSRVLKLRSPFFCLDQISIPMM